VVVVVVVVDTAYLAWIFYGAGAPLNSNGRSNKSQAIGLTRSHIVRSCRAVLDRLLACAHLDLRLGLGAHAHCRHFAAEARQPSLHLHELSHEVVHLDNERRGEETRGNGRQCEGDTKGMTENASVKGLDSGQIDSRLPPPLRAGSQGGSRPAPCPSQAAPARPQEPPRVP